MERHENQCNIAIEIAIESGVLQRCEGHDEVVFEDSEDITEAYKLADLKFSSGEIKEFFDNKSEMTDVIKQVVEENCSDECSSCAHYRDQ